MANNEMHAMLGEQSKCFDSFTLGRSDLSIWSSKATDKANYHSGEYSAGKPNTCEKQLNTSSMLSDRSRRRKKKSKTRKHSKKRVKSMN